VSSEKELLSPFYAANCSGIPSIPHFVFTFALYSKCVFGLFIFYVCFIDLFHMYIIQQYPHFCLFSANSTYMYYILISVELRVFFLLFANFIVLFSNLCLFLVLFLFKTNLYIKLIKYNIFNPHQKQHPCLKY
jgi:hypothetical protein